MDSEPVRGPWLWGAGQGVAVVRYVILAAALAMAVLIPVFMTGNEVAAIAMSIPVGWVFGTLAGWLECRRESLSRAERRDMLKRPER